MSNNATLSDKIVASTKAPIRSTMRPTSRLRIRTAANRFGDEGELIAPEGYTYEWKVMKVHGETAVEHITNWKLNGWTEVPAGRHPDFTNASPDSTEAIIRGGQVLCERPAELTAEAKAMEKKVADDQVNSQLERLALRAKATQSERGTRIKRTVEAISDDT